MSKLFGKIVAEKATDVEYTDVSELESEVNEALAEKPNDDEKKTKKEDDSRGKAWFKTAGKVALGVVGGFAAAVVTGLVLSRRDDDDELDECYSWDNSDGDETEEDTEEGD